MYGTRWLKKFCKGDESLEDEGCSGQPLEVDNNQLRGSLKLILIQLHKKLPKNSGSTILWSAGIWSKLERWKSLISGCLMSWRQIKIIVILKCGLLILCNNKPFLDWIVACDEKWILYDNQQWPAQWLDREEAPEHFLKPKLHPKKRVMVTVWWSAAPPIHYSSESWRNRYVWELGSASRWDAVKTAPAAAVPVDRESPVLLHDNAPLRATQPALQKVGYEGSCSD